MQINIAKQIMGDHFIGPDELKKCQPILNFNIPHRSPTIQYDEETLNSAKENYYLILGASAFNDGKSVTCRNLKSLFGSDSEASEPCFYNQDWYDYEYFMDEPMKEGWYLIRKEVYEDSREVMPTLLMKTLAFPSAICCTYSFFVTWLTKGEILWNHDYVWCSDLDHNGDRVYVGKYHDIDGINKNGFSIHRHLSLRQCYGAINVE